MKKLLFFITVIAFGLISLHGVSQNLVQNGGLESWNNSTTPTGWDIYDNISQESTQVHSGAYSASHESASSSKKLSQDIDSIVEGQQYHIIYYYKDNDPNARTRIWSYWMQDGNYLDADANVLRPATYSQDNSEWQVFDVTLTAPATANEFRFEVRVYKQDNNIGGHVYYDDFSMQTDNTIYPEPSNYPSGFTATANGININLAWTDATGNQIPTGYLIKGEMVTDRGCEPPVDGIPVANDLDWSDSNVAVNVSYGDEYYTFESLVPNQAYNFCIFPYTNGGANIDYKTGGTVPEDSATTANVTIINSENFDNGLGTWTPNNVHGDQEWNQSTYGNKTFAKMSGYDSGSSFANEDWLISPAMNLSTYQTVIFTFTSSTKYNGNPLQLFYSTDYDDAGNPNDFTWTEITNQASWSDGNYNWIESGNVSLTSYVANGFYLAFKYTSTNDASAAWEVDGLLVSGIKNVGVSENKQNNIAFYPNPATDHIVITAEDNATVQLFDLTGKPLENVAIVKGENYIPLNNITKGLYILQMKSKGHTFIAKLMVK